MLLLFLTLIYSDYIMATPCGRKNPNGPYKALKDNVQKKNKQQENNLTNQQQRFDYENGTDGPNPVPLWPCRAAPNMTNPHVWKRGQVVTVETQGNNLHAAYMELNLFRGNEVHQALTPTKTGAGFSRSGTNITIPHDFPKCGKSDGCFLQFHLYTREPRNYVTCSDFILEGDVEAVTAEVNSDCPDESKLYKTDRLYYKKQTKGQNATEVIVSPTQVKTNLMPVIPYNDAKVYTDVSMNFEPYGGQSRSYPPSALKMWKLTLPGEVGQLSVKNGIIKNKEREIRKQFRKVIKELRDTAEIPIRCYQKYEADQITKKIRAAFGDPVTIMMEQKGKENNIGYYPAARNIAYLPQIYFKPTPGDDFKPQRNMQLLSSPNLRQSEKTYIDIVGPCIDQLYSSVVTLEKTNVDARLKNPYAPLGDVEAEKAKVLKACSNQIKSSCPQCANSHEKTSTAENPDDMDSKNMNKNESKKPMNSKDPKSPPVDPKTGSVYLMHPPK
eukprot:NODE_587_length_6372_cov_0.270524.p2 type:complete len:498 gc:universal NODE_587_length_6372_cov_0.270524:4294-2801(-)